MGARVLLAAAGRHASAPNLTPRQRVLTGVSAGAMCVVDLDNRHVLYRRNELATQIYAASTVKVLTMRLALEHFADLDEILTYIASDNPGPFITELDLTSGETLTVRDALFATLIDSSSDVANLLARVVGNQRASRALNSPQGYTDFYALMNARAAASGALATTYGSAWGEDTNTTTARDMAFVLGDAMNSAAMTPFYTASHTVQIIGPTPRSIPIAFSNPTNLPGFLISKGGAYVPPNTYALVSLWESPNGTRICVASVDSNDAASRFPDHLSITNRIVGEHPYLSA